MITQEEVDSVAYFIEAATHLKQQNLFSEDEPRTIIKNQGSNPPVLETGPSTHLEAAINPFRKIWMSDEPSNFYRVCNILHKSSVSNTVKSYIAGIRSNHQNLADNQISPFESWTNLKRRDIIELYLYNKVSHSGADKSRRFTRKDFENHRNTIGKERFEFIFRNAFAGLSICYFNLLRIAKSELIRYEKDYKLKPSFAISPPFGHDGEATGSIQRANSLIPPDETPEQKVRRILRRKRFDELRNFLARLGILEAKIYKFVLNVNSAQEFIAKLGYSVKQVAIAEIPPNMQWYSGFLDINTNKSGLFAGIEGQTLFSTEFGMELLNQKLLEFKKALFENSSK
jgi:hypothetical protein